MSERLQNAAVYVGTYEKYNKGSLDGAWMSLSDFESSEKFYNYCKKLHAEERDPELMYQDYKYTAGLVTEDSINNIIFDLIHETSELDEEIQEAFYKWLVYESISIDSSDAKEIVDKFQDRWVGYFGGLFADPMKSFAHEIAKNEFDMDSPIAQFFDYDSFIRDLRMEFYEIDGHIFRCY